MNHIFAAAYLHALSLSQKNQLQNFLCVSEQVRQGMAYVAVHTNLRTYCLYVYSKMGISCIYCYYQCQSEELE